MMKQMRENTKWIMLVTALAFVALMVFEWGMDASGRTSMGVGQIGSVDGRPVMYQEYMATYRNLYDQVQQSQEDPISSRRNEEIEDAAWDEVVNQILIRQELNRRGIEVAPEEIRQAARFSPPPNIRQNPAFQTDGQFDLQKYQDFLATSADNALLLQLEQYYRDVIPRSKLLRQVTTGIYPSDADLWWRYRQQNERVRLRLAALSPRVRVPDSLVSVSEEEIDAYYQDNREAFRVPARAQLRVVHLNMAPTPRDTAAALELAREIRQEILSGADFAEVARRESADESSAQRGGDLGTFARGGMVPPFEEAAFSAREGEITEPVRTRFGFHVIQVRERQADSVTASHILVPVERTDESELRLLTRADSLENLLESRTLEEAAEIMGIHVQSYTLSESFPVVPGLGRVTEGADWALEEAQPGDVSPLFENDRAFYAFELIERQPEGYRTVDEVRDAIVRNIRLEKQKERAADGARELAARARESGSLDDVSGEPGTSVQEIEPLNRFGNVPGVASDPQVVGTAFGLSEGEISDPVVGAESVYLVELLERIPADSAAWEAQKEEQRRGIMGRLQQQRLQQWLAGLREQAEIDDRREEVLRPPDEQQQRQGFPASPF